MTANDFNWKHPVDVILPSGLRRRFTNAYDALVMRLIFSTQNGRPAGASPITGRSASVA